MLYNPKKKNQMTWSQIGRDEPRKLYCVNWQKSWENQLDVLLSDEYHVLV